MHRNRSINENDSTNSAFDYLPRLIFVLLICLYVVLETHWYFAAGRDDTYISLWSGYGLANGYGFVNYNIQPLEVSSSFLHVLFIAVMWLVAPEHVYVLNKILGLVFGLLTLVVIYRSSAVFFPHYKNAVYASLAVIILLLSSIVWMYWNLGGLENAIVTFLIVCFARVSVESWQRSVIFPFRLGFITALLVLVRSEGFLYLGALLCFVVIWVLVSKSWNRALWLLLAIPIVTQSSLTIWRWFSFNALFPNPTYAKVNVGNVLNKWTAGWSYLVGFYRDSPFHMYMLIALVYCVLLLFIQRFRQQNETNIPGSYFVLLGIVSLNHVFIILVGRDWMELYRFVQPVIPILAIITVGWFGSVARQITSVDSLTKRHPLDLVQHTGLAAVVIVLALQVYMFSGTTVTLFPLPLLITLNFLIGLLFVADVWLRGTDKKVLVGFLVLLGVSAFVVLPRNYHTLNTKNYICGKPLHSDALYALDLGIVMADIQQKSCVFVRDDKLIKNYITPHYEKFAAQHNNQVRMRSGQGGYIPFYLKTTFPTIDFTFVDDNGLVDAYVARLKQKNARYKTSPEFLAYLESSKINIWYLIPYSEKNTIANLKKYPDWEVVFRAPYGYVVVKK